MAGLDPATQQTRVRAANDSTLASRFKPTMPSGFVYILASKRNGTLYTGITSDLPGRLRAHREGKGSAFVKKYGVTRLVYYEEHKLYVVAIQRETSIKRWKREWKIALIEKFNPEWEDLLKYWNM
jgi:putative endonuclease